MIVVSDSSPLIALLSVDRIDILERVSFRIAPVVVNRALARLYEPSL